MKNKHWILGICFVLFEAFTLDEKPLAGVKIAMFGDSVTEFGDYPEQVSLLTGAETYKMGFGGCRMGSRVVKNEKLKAYEQLSMVNLSHSAVTDNYESVTEAVNYLAEEVRDDNSAALNVMKNVNLAEVDIITVFFGTNDFTSNENPIGEADSTNPFELKGAMNLIIDNLSKFNKRLIFITPTHRFFKNKKGLVDANEEPNGIGLYLKDYRDAILEHCRYRKVECIDMYTLSGFNPFNHHLYFRWLEKKKEFDGVHPNKEGYFQIASVISSYLVTHK